jgi:hypothetical protein
MESIEQEIARITEAIDQCHFQLNKLGQIDPRTDDEERKLITFVHYLESRERQLAEAQSKLPRR